MGTPGIGYQDGGTGSFGFQMTSDGQIKLGNTSDDVIQVTGTLDVNGNVSGTAFYGDGSNLTSMTPAGSDTQIQYNDNGSIAASDDFIFDGSKVGIGTDTPDEALHIKKSNSGGDVTCKIENTSNTANAHAQVRLRANTMDTYLRTYEDSTTGGGRFEINLGADSDPITMRIVSKDLGENWDSTGLGADDTLLGVVGEDAILAVVSEDNGTYSSTIALKEVASDLSTFNDGWGIVKQTKTTGEGKLKFTYGTGVDVSQNSTILLLTPAGDLVCDAMQQYISVTLATDSDALAGDYNPFDIDNGATFTTNSNNGITFDSSTGRLTISKAGDYEITAVMYMLQSSANALANFEIRKNGSSIWSANTVIHNSVDWAERTMHGIFTLVADDYIEIVIDSGATATLTTGDGSGIVVKRIA